MGKDIVKINAKGRVSIQLTANMAELIKPIIERLLDVLQSSHPLTQVNVQERIYIDLLQDLYLKYYTELDISKEKYKITMSKAQALALWDCGQTYDTIVYCHPVMNTLLLQLHQKLAR